MDAQMVLSRNLDAFSGADYEYGMFVESFLFVYAFLLVQK